MFRTHPDEKKYKKCEKKFIITPGMVIRVN